MLPAISTTSLLLALSLQPQSPAKTPPPSSTPNNPPQSATQNNPRPATPAPKQKVVGQAWSSSPPAKAAPRSNAQPAQPAPRSNPQPPANAAPASAPQNQSTPSNQSVQRFGVQTELHDPAPEARPNLQRNSQAPAPRQNPAATAPPQNPGYTKQPVTPAPPATKRKCDKGYRFLPSGSHGDLQYSVNSHYFIRAAMDQNPFFGHKEAQRGVVQRVRVSGSFRWRHLGIKSEWQDVRFWGNAPSTLNSGGQLRLYQGYLEFSAANEAHKYRSFFRVGRQSIAIGQQRLIGKSNWNPNGRSFDAVRAFSALREFEAEAFWSLINSGRSLDPKTGTLIPRRQLGALRLAYKPKPYLQGELLGLLHLEKAPAPSEDRSTIGNLGARLWGQVLKQPDQNLEYDLEANFQFGKKVDTPHRAWAIAGRLNYLRTISKFQIGLLAEAAAASGNRSDAKSREFFNFYPSNHRIYGLLDLIGWRNMVDLQFGLHGNFAKMLSINIDYHDLWLQSSEGRWSSFNGKTIAPAASSTANPKLGKRLGSEIDLRLTYKPAPAFFFRLGYGIFFPDKDAQKRANLPPELHKPVGRAYLWMMANL